MNKCSTTLNAFPFIVTHKKSQGKKSSQLPLASQRMPRLTLSWLYPDFGSLLFALLLTPARKVGQWDAGSHPRRRHSAHINSRPLTSGHSTSFPDQSKRSHEIQGSFCVQCLQNLKSFLWQFHALSIVM